MHVHTHTHMHASVSYQANTQDEEALNLWTQNQNVLPRFIQKGNAELCIVNILNIVHYHFAPEPSQRVKLSRTVSW